MRGRTAPPHPRIYRVPPRYVTLGARDFTSAVSGDPREKPGGAWASFGIDWYPQITIPWVPEVFLVASAYGRRCVGLRPTLNIPAAREKNLWYPGYRYVSIPVNSKRRPCPPPGKEKFWWNSPVCWQFRWSNAPPASASKSVKSPAYQWLF